MEDDDNWSEGGSRYGYGGMKIFDGQTRTTERRIKEHPDGTREIVETIIEKNVSSRFVTGATDRQFEIGMASCSSLFLVGEIRFISWNWPERRQRLGRRWF